MAASNESEETYLHLFIGYVDTALDNIDNIFSPSSSELGIPDKLEKLGDKIHTLLRPGKNKQHLLAQHRASTATLPNTTTALPINTAALPNTTAALPHTTTATLQITAPAVLPNDESIECCLSKLQDVSLSTEELMDIALILVDKADMSDVVERDDNTYECLVCKTTVSDTICLMKHVHNVHHKLKQKVSRKMCQTNVKVPTEPSDLMWYVVNKMNPLSPHCVIYLDPEVYHCTICNKTLNGNTEVVIRHNMRESHRNKYLELHKKPAQQVKYPSSGLPIRAPSTTRAQHDVSACMLGPKKVSFVMSSVVQQSGGNRVTQSTTTTRLHDNRDPPNESAHRQPMDMLRDRKESFERKLELMWQLLKEIEDTEETNISYDSEKNIFWCCICDSTMYSSMNVIQHSKGKKHQFMQLVETKKSNLVEGFYSGDRPKEEELMWEILNDIEDDNISDLGNSRYYCQECEVNICGPRNVIEHIDGEKHGNASRPSSE